jgi:hypothetical protein
MDNVDLISLAHDGVHCPLEGILTPLGSIHWEQEVTAHFATTTKEEERKVLKEEGRKRRRDR